MAPTWRQYARNEQASCYLQVEWSDKHEVIIEGKIGVPDHQSSWEALMYVLALKTWIDKETIGVITVIGDASWGQSATSSR